MSIDNRCCSACNPPRAPAHQRAGRVGQVRGGATLSCHSITSVAARVIPRERRPTNGLERSYGHRAAQIEPRWGAGAGRDLLVFWIELTACRLFGLSFCFEYPPRLSHPTYWLTALRCVSRSSTKTSWQPCQMSPKVCRWCPCCRRASRMRNRLGESSRPSCWHCANRCA